MAIVCLVVLTLPLLWRISTTARFKRAVPNPARFLVAFPLDVVPASGFFLTVFCLSKIEVISGPTTGLSMLN